MLNVEHKITIKRDVWSSTENSRLLDLQVSLSLAIPVNDCQVKMTIPKGISVSPSDEIKIELGNGNEKDLVFTGIVDHVDWQIDQVEIHAMSCFRNLINAYPNMFFEKSNASDIIKDICSDADVKTDKVDQGIKFSSYALGGRVSAYDSIHHLSLQCGVDVFANNKDKLVFTKPLGLLSHDFQFGVNVLELSVEFPDPQIKKVVIYGESPASQGQGPDASSWLTKNEVKGTANGQGKSTIQLFDPSIRTQENAISVANAILDKRKNKKKAQIKTLGFAKVQLTDSIKISKMPVENQNGKFKVIGITHKVTNRLGFISYIKIEEK